MVLFVAKFENLVCSRDKDEYEFDLTFRLVQRDAEHPWRTTVFVLRGLQLRVMAQILRTTLEIHSGDNTVPSPPPKGIGEAYGDIFG